MRKNLYFLLYAFFFLSLFSCGEGNSGEFIVKRKTSWEEENLQGKVKEYITYPSLSNMVIASYSKFNPQGYLVEKGTFIFHNNNKTNPTIPNKVSDKITYAYYADGTLKEEATHYGDGHKEKVKKYTPEGELSEEIQYHFQYDRARTYKTSTKKYEYENTGKRTYKVFIDGKLTREVKYDKYKNALSETYYNYGHPSNVREYKYAYDKQGNITRKLEYESRPFVQKKRGSKKEEYIYKYNQDGRLDEIKCYHFTDDKKELLWERTVEYDRYGNSLGIHNGIRYEYDAEGNWILRSGVGRDQHRFLRYY